MSGSFVDGRERFGREGLLRAAQADADHAELAHLGHRLLGGGRHLGAGVADQVGDQGDLDVGGPVQPGSDRGGQRLDGQALVLASQPGQQATQLAILDPRSFSVIHSWSADTYATWVTEP